MKSSSRTILDVFVAARDVAIDGSEGAWAKIHTYPYSES
jgi:hypothetical protein